MFKNILAVIGAAAIVAGVVALAVLKPWNDADVVATNGAEAPVVYFDALRGEGVVVERVHVDTGRKPRAVLYVSYSEFFKAPVLLRAYDKSGKEVGRSRRELSGDREDAGYADFEFNARVPLKSVTFFRLAKSQVDAVPAAEVVPVAVEEPAPEEPPAVPADVPVEEEPAAESVPADAQ